MKKSIAILCIILIIFSLTSCSAQASYVDDESDDSPLQVYIMYWSDSEKAAIGKFNALVAKGDIDARRIEYTEFQYEQLEEMYNRIANEILAGKGPDIIFIDYFFCAANDFVKIASQNAFADMDILAANSSTFSYDDYNKIVMDGAVINGARSFMPISYYVPYIYSTEETITNSGIDVPDMLTYENILNIIDEFEKNKPMMRHSIYYDMLVYNIFNLFPSMTLDDDIFVTIQNRIKNIYQENNNDASSSYMGDITKDKAVFDTVTYFGWNQFNNIMIDYTLIKKQYDRNMVFWNFPCDKNGNTKAIIDNGIAINICSKHKNDAFKFVEYMMSYDFNISQDKTNSCITVPVNIQAYNELKNKFNKSSFTFNTMDDTYFALSLPDDLANEYIELIESPKVCEFNGQGVYIYCNLVRDTLKEYYTQKIDYDTMIEQLKTKLNLYYSE